MKKLLTIALLAALSVQASQTQVYFDLNPPYFNAIPASNRVVTLQPLSPVPGNLITFTSSVSGTFTFTNPYVGDYAGTIKAYGASSAITFQLTVTSTNLGTINAHENTSLGGIPTYPQTGRSAWSIAASDARYTRTANIGLQVLDGITATNQSFSTSTNGTDFNITTTVLTNHQFNLPIASASKTGKLSSNDWSTFNAKENALTFFNNYFVRSGDLIQIADAVANGTQKGVSTYTSSDFDTASGVVSIDYSNGQKASASVSGFLSATDWTTFNSKSTIYTNSTSNPNGVVTATAPAIIYNYRGAIWVKTNTGSNNTGWDCIVTNRP